MLKKAIRLKLRFQTSKGYISIEDLWDLSLRDLNELAKVLNKRLKASKEEDFLEEKSEEDAIIKLKFDIVLDVMETKKLEDKAKRNASKNKIEREKILTEKARRQDAGLKEVSDEELDAKLKELEENS